jgi:hypothetical protein
VSGPAVLVVTSSSSPAAAVVPLLAALDAAGAAVRALDVGRLGARAGGVAQQVVRAIAGELNGRKLERELEDALPAVALAFDPATVGALDELRRGRPFAVVGVVAELDPADDWSAAVADRFLVLDDHAAVRLAELGQPADRILPIGPLAPAGFASAAREDRAALRARFKIAAGAPVVLIEVAGLGAEAVGQLALQLSLQTAPATYLFAAGDDVDAAAVLRARVPTLGLRAKLFGASGDVPLYYRAADVVVGPPRLRTALATLAVGARLVAMGEAGEAGRRLAEALEARGLGAHADGALLLGAALEPILARGPAPAPTDGAADAADAILVVARDAAAIAAASAAAAAEPVEARGPTARPAAPSRPAAPPTAAGDLEDLGGDDGDLGAAPPPRAAPREGPAPPRPAAAPPRSVDDELRDLKRGGGPAATAPRAGAPRAEPRHAVDDELAALKRKMTPKPKP